MIDRPSYFLVSMAMRNALERHACHCADMFCLRKYGDKSECPAQRARSAIARFDAVILGAGDMDYIAPDTLHLAEDAESAHMVLDRLGVPRNDKAGQLSLVGRINAALAAAVKGSS